MRFRDLAWLSATLIVSAPSAFADPVIYAAGQRGSDLLAIDAGTGRSDHTRRIAAAILAAPRLSL